MAQRVAKPAKVSGKSATETHRVAVWVGWLLILVGLAFAASTVLLPTYAGLSMPLIVVIPMVLLCAATALGIALVTRHFLLFIAAFLTAASPWWITVLAMLLVF
ncbi:hypothetical protein KRX51_09445 [Corynebacterium sp. TAE3-ERU12]|uniref:hypothetical protein n=1 Tax=Corynebacterium sp. TAE3-ERU12 TaxID=2849491 RepID=UPI001C47BD2F|nr:hypothetical protein [Corynebacterium sp. TAE3-ERU12]MBV7296133.1 hypothetical protein [Corynebacterium sp. TAE3-ERU12]